MGVTARRVRELTNESGPGFGEACRLRHNSK